MNWSTPVSVPKGSKLLDYESRVLLLGSCFASHLGSKLNYFQFRAQTNPFGVIFHPEPLAVLVRRALNRETFVSDELFEHQSLWRCFQTHSSLAQPNREAALNTLNNTLNDFREQLLSASHLIITLGSAYSYRYLDTNQRVANCHSVTANSFSKELSNPVEIQRNLEELIKDIREVNPEAEFILTVSPVRHLRDGLIENQRSKSHLITAAHQIVDRGWAFYYPAFEILMDELRDYRFYDRDLTHPSAVAVDYIWEQFRSAWISDTANELMHEVDIIRKSLMHRSLHPDSEAYNRFVTGLNTRVAQLLQRYPYMDFSLKPIPE